MQISIKATDIIKFFLFIIALLFLANLMASISILYCGHDSVHGIVPLFNFDKEYNIPTFFSSFSLLFCGLLLVIISFDKNNTLYEKTHWAALALVFTFLALDESMFFHEQIGVFLKNSLGQPVRFIYAWTVPYALVIIFIIAIYFKFFTRLDKKIQRNLLLAMVVYLSGALGLEYCAFLFGCSEHNRHLLYIIFYTVEETLEMLGIVLFIKVLFEYIHLKADTLSIIIKS